MKALVLLAAVAASSAIAPAPNADWQLVWADEFDGNALDESKWVLANDCWGGGNDERQCYTPDAANHRVSCGMLEIVARQENHTGAAFPRDQQVTPERRAAQSTKPFTSARLATTGRASWLYGKVQVRAKLPQGQGTWPAIWMLPEEWAYGGWARSGEIDIMEAVNLGEQCETCKSGRENHVLGTIHFGGEPPLNRYIGDQTALDGDTAGFHTYEVEWNSAGITWRVDGKSFETRQPHEWHTLGSSKAGAPFDRRFYLILNLAIGGHLPEGRNNNGVAATGYPKTMVVDWVRVWQRAPAPRGVDAGKIGSPQK